MLKKYKIPLNPTPEQETYFKKGRGIAANSLSILFWANGKTSRNRGKKKTVGEIKKWLNKIKGRRLSVVLRDYKNRARIRHHGFAKGI